MKRLGRIWYVGLLSAAARHGATHQAAHRLQIVVDRPDNLHKLRTFGVTVFVDKHAARWPTRIELDRQGPVPVATVRRLGYLLAPTTPSLDLEPLVQRAQSNSSVTPLAVDGPATGPVRTQWRLRVNASVEIDDL